MRNLAALMVELVMEVFCRLEISDILQKTSPLTLPSLADQAFSPLCFTWLVKRCQSDTWNMIKNAACQLPSSDPGGTVCSRVLLTGGVERLVNYVSDF